MQQFHERDPLTPAFWDERFAGNFTPWDRGGVPQALRDFAAAAPTPLTTLIPGCGSAHELACLAEAGWDVTAIDFSPAAVAAAKAAVGPWAGRVVEADFFAWRPAAPLQLIYERAFLCAMPRALWPRVAARWAELLAPGALLAGYFFFDNAAKGPPFGIAREQLDALLAPHFDCVEDAAVADSIAVFEGKERWLVWRRR
ncbi:methyltransferase domain-containing protein [Rugamonas sp. CCM 8940]|uniref:methyltransferase domain-containing protein n=1 Tax=Rugamonas sp. CCM 8940 TaxID=2765359 RepID=UPI0018F61F95|nr:methyltransferase domain-containing protein [Rugamonas sp. CCM 8940]MBJ7310341.1 methyltransferase domain-containing protein [Rugamonas sp. CCM 8940]